MSLKAKYIFWIAILLATVMFLGGVSIVNLVMVRRAGTIALAEYEALGRADSIAVQVAWLRDSLAGVDAPLYRDAKFFDPLLTEINEINMRLELASRIDDGDAAKERDLGAQLVDHLSAASAQSRITDGPSSAAANAASARKAAAELDRVHCALLDTVKLMPDAARRHVMAVNDHVLDRIQWTCVWLVIVLAVSGVIHYRQYRMLVAPLLWLREDMRESAANDYHKPVRQRGEREFKEVAAYFNGIAKDLANLYHNLEQKVITRSRELVRSERLASVGFLAAGVAHEINNPLSVISGYAELAAKSLRRVVLGDHAASADESEAEAEALTSALQAQDIIRDEAFRCKEITSRLLSLARGGDDGRQPLCMDDVARQVTILTKGLKNYRDRRVVLDFKSSESLEVVANASEMKQVLLNLTVNALEAVSPERGEVRIGGQRMGSWVELSVEDNGKGMAPETLEHVFEPFFTAKRGAGEPGTGLGLSITHAIIENHGGRIRAESQGPGRGSRFTFRLPALIHKVAGAGLAAV